MSSLSEFEVVKCIGRGSFGRALLANKKDTGEQCVLKEIALPELSAKAQAEAKNEVAVMSKLHHPHVVQYFGSFLEEEVLYIHMEFCEFGDLSQLISFDDTDLLDEDIIRDYFTQICEGLKYVHDQSCLHRDLKMQNVFVCGDGVLKLGDFGVARVLGTETNFAQTMIGTPYYLSPEICEDRPYDQKSDIWALGCILYEMTTRKRAFTGQNLPALVFKILSGTYPRPPDKYSKSLVTLIDTMLQKNPTKRPTVDEVLVSAFVRGVDEEIATAEVAEKGAGEVRMKPGEDKARRGATKQRAASGQSSTSTSRVGSRAASREKGGRLEKNEKGVRVVQVNLAPTASSPTRSEATTASVESPSPRLPPRYKITPKKKEPEPQQQDVREWVRKQDRQRQQIREALNAKRRAIISPMSTLEGNMAATKLEDRKRDSDSRERTTKGGAAKGVTRITAGRGKSSATSAAATMGARGTVEGQERRRSAMGVGEGGSGMRRASSASSTGRHSMGSRGSVGSSDGGYNGRKGSVSPSVESVSEVADDEFTAEEREGERRRGGVARQKPPSVAGDVLGGEDADEDEGKARRLEIGGVDGRKKRRQWSREPVVDMKGMSTVLTQKMNERGVAPSRERASAKKGEEVAHAKAPQSRFPAVNVRQGGRVVQKKAASPPPRLGGGAKKAAGGMARGGAGANNDGDVGGEHRKPRRVSDWLSEMRHHHAEEEEKRKDEFRQKQEAKEAEKKEIRDHMKKHRDGLKHAKARIKVDKSKRAGGGDVQFEIVMPDAVKDAYEKDEEKNERGDEEGEASSYAADWESEPAAVEDRRRQRRMRGRGSSGEDGEEQDVTAKEEVGGEEADQRPAPVRMEFDVGGGKKERAKADNARENEYLGNRVEQLRKMCEDGLGDELFIKVYRSVRRMQEDGADEYEPHLLTALGQERLKYLRHVQHLVVCEDRLYS